MKRFDHYILQLLILAVVLTGCEEGHSLLQDTQNDESVAATVAFAVTVPTTMGTRMSGAVVQEDGQPYRGIDMQRIVPFAVAGKITATDMPKMFQVVGNGEKPEEERAYYYYDNCVLMKGVASFLSYGRAPKSSPEDKAANGSVIETFPLSMAPKDIRFSLDPISNKVVHNVANSLAHYMTLIATAKGNEIAWKNAPSATLKLMYINFLNLTEVESSGNILPGSSADIKAYTQALKGLLVSLTLTDPTDIAIRTAIIAQIDASADKLDPATGEWGNFPASVGLPDGAAVIRWDGEKFVAEISNTMLADINGIDRFAYPAELYYYGNSRINTSNLDKRKEQYNDRSWTEVLNTYEYPNSTVGPNTQAVAIREPLQYGVARLQIRLKETDYHLLDAKGTSVEVGTDKFPLTGVIVGGQLPVGFDFKPTTSYPTYSEADMVYIYDSQVKTNGSSGNEYFYLNSSADASKMTNTLVLQTYDHKKIPVVLEFINNSDKDFVGLHGIVYKGTKFYLVAEVDPAEAISGATAATQDRVFTQDYTTTLNMKVTGLSKAYNVVPNLLSPRLELGVELVTKWVSTTPEEIIL